MRDFDEDVFDDSTEIESVDDEEDDSSPIQERAFEKGYNEEIKDPYEEGEEIEEAEW
ncbi:hypothetical protein JXB27_03860 [Candidatus Woesearchaeota archaeon]|nr:hypothetical protein [Candidatus Woesearchaeota archaeon]